MKFSCNKEISYEEAVTTMFEKLGNAQIMALASSLNDYVMVRNVSCLFYDEKIYFKTDKNFILVDPVMGDHGKLYPTYTQEMQEKMRELMPYATIVTPNLTELCALIDETYHETTDKEELSRMCQKLSQMGPQYIVVTGISVDDQILNFIYDHGHIEILYVKRMGEDRSGTGDVISAVIAGSYLKGDSFLEAVRKSTDFASKCIQHSVDIDAHPHMGLCFEPLLKELGD